MVRSCIVVRLHVRAGTGAAPGDLRRRTFVALAALVVAGGAGCKKKTPVFDDGEAEAPTAPDARGLATASHDPAVQRAGDHDEAGAPAAGRELVGPGFPEPGPWVSFYGTAAQMGDLAKVARTYRIINIDADPGAGNFTDAQIKTLRAGGANRVISYFNVGACEHYRSYWSRAPEGVVPCGANRAAQRGAYQGYPDETWMDPSNADYQRLILEHVGPRLAARVDGFYLDNLEILEHGSMSSNGSCSAACRQGGLDLVRKLREKFPDHLIVMQNATSDVTRLGTTGGVAFPRLLDGVAHEEVYAPKHDASAEQELVAWKAMGLATRSGRPFWIAVEDYAGSCANKAAAHAALARARAKGFSPYVSDESGGQKVVCYWD